jgi:DNA-binding transcriptional LysR family regulator
MSGFTLRQLEIFAQVVERGSFRRCAESLGVSQVSISEHVRELEARLGVKLFHRNAGGPATLTTEGEQAYRRVSGILADINDLTWEVGGGGRKGVRTRLGVALHPYVLRRLGSSLAEFKAKHQVEVTLDFELATPDQLHQRVQSRELDLAYIMTFDGHDAPFSDLVCLEPLGIFVGAHHPLAHKQGVTAAEIRATPGIHLAPRNPLRQAVDRALQQANCTADNVLLQADEYGLILHSTQTGEGFACMFQSMAEELLTAGIVQVALEHPIPALQVRQIVRHSAHHDPLVKPLIDTLGRALRAG